MSQRQHLVGWFLLSLLLWSDFVAASRVRSFAKRAEFLGRRSRAKMFEETSVIEQAEILDIARLVAEHTVVHELIPQLWNRISTDGYTPPDEDFVLQAAMDEAEDDEDVAKAIFAFLEMAQAVIEEGASTEDADSDESGVMEEEEDDEQEDGFTINGEEEAAFRKPSVRVEEEDEPEPELLEIGSQSKAKTRIGSRGKSLSHFDSFTRTQQKLFRLAFGKVDPSVVDKATLASIAELFDSTSATRLEEHLCVFPSHDNTRCKERDDVSKKVPEFAAVVEKLPPALVNAFGAFIKQLQTNMATDEQRKQEAQMSSAYGMTDEPWHPTHAAEQSRLVPQTVMLETDSTARGLSGFVNSVWGYVTGLATPAVAQCPLVETGTAIVSNLLGDLITILGYSQAEGRLISAYFMNKSFGFLGCAAEHKVRWTASATAAVGPFQVLGVGGSDSLLALEVFSHYLTAFAVLFYTAKAAPFFIDMFLNSAYVKGPDTWADLTTKTKQAQARKKLGKAQNADIATKAHQFIIAEIGRFIDSANWLAKKSSSTSLTAMGAPAMARWLKTKLQQFTGDSRTVFMVTAILPVLYTLRLWLYAFRTGGTIIGTFVALGWHGPSILGFFGLA